MSGLFLNFGRNKDQQVKFEGVVAPTSLFVRLITDETIALTENFGSGLTEVTGEDYAAKELSLGVAGDWTISGDLATGNEVEFAVPTGHTWSNVRGYAISETADGNNAHYAELFPAGRQGDKVGPDVIKIIPKFRLICTTQA